MRCEALNMKGCFSEKVFVVSTLEDGFALPFISYLPALLRLKNVSSHTHTHTLKTSSPSLTPLCTHTKASTHKHKPFPAHCNMNRHLLTASHLDVTALLASFAILKTPFLSLSSYKQMVANLLGSHRGHVKAAFFFSPTLSQFILENITSCSPLCTETMSHLRDDTSL